MARDNAQEKRDNLNRGLPKHSGLDEGTQASLRRALDGGDGGVKVGSFRDLQLGDTDIPVEDRPVNPNQDEGDVITVHEHIAREEAATAATSDDDLDSYTVEELKDKLADKGKPVSGTKDELIARLKE